LFCKTGTTRRCSAIPGHRRKVASETLPLPDPAPSPAGAGSTKPKQIIKRIMKALTCNGALIEEEGMSYLAEMETDAALSPLQSAPSPDSTRLGVP
jgi:hypothetical protein